MVCAVINGEDLPHKNELIEKLTEIPSVKSIVLNINRDRTNVILGKECVTVWGNDCIYDVLCGVKVRLSPLSFYQVNHDMAQQLYERRQSMPVSAAKRPCSICIAERAQ